MIRAYIDTSVFGGVFDEEFRDASLSFFNLTRSGIFQIVISSVVSKEVESAPDKVKQFFLEQLRSSELVQITSETLILRKAYMDSKILTEKSISDALHVAAASVSRCSMIISWNFKHIVNFQKIPLYQAVNAVRGYPKIEIYSPLEVINYEV
jgi:predicted nucleic acid-binding protein